MSLFRWILFLLFFYLLWRFIRGLLSVLKPTAGGRRGRAGGGPSASGSPPKDRPIIPEDQIQDAKYEDVDDKK
ncbi:MAG: hypothetical protein COS95_04295 [Ignavibacteriales bacterium CG07_land_8_20_14_0_80_59_12]|nr:MAG: hypothetical protein COS95_04295 [Ignavibacteriales bacterium CG07_land_8_20_14_0_80_59_12]